MRENERPRLQADVPLPEEYGQVTDPERFLALHLRAHELVDRLIREYDVAKTDTFVLPRGCRSFEYAHPPVTLTPASPDAAPVSIAFTTFPSLLVRCGQFFSKPFPVCGCDACGATADGEGEDLELLLYDVASGYFREEIKIPLLGKAKVSWTLGDVAAVGHASGRGWGAISRHEARTLIGNGPKRIQWKPWPRRGERHS